MAGNLESRANHGFFNRTARNIGLGIGAIALALASGCTAHKNSAKTDDIYQPSQNTFSHPDYPNYRTSESDKPSKKEKRLPLFEVGIGLGEGNSYSFIGGKLSGFLNIDRNNTFELGISYGFGPIMLPNGVIMGKFVTNGSAGFHYKFMDEQSLFLRAFYGIQGVARGYDDCGHITSFDDIYGGGLLIGTRFASSEGVFIEMGIGASILVCPSGYRKKYSSKGALDFGIGFKFG